MLGILGVPRWPCPAASTEVLALEYFRAGHASRHCCPPSTGTWHKLHQDLKHSLRDTLTFSLLRSGLRATCGSQPFPPQGVFPVLFSSVATIPPAVLFRLQNLVYSSPSSNLCDSAAWHPVMHLIFFPFLKRGCCPFIFYSYLICWTNVTATVTRSIWTWQLQILKGNYMCTEL